jgi:hypothetical protein
MPAQVPQDNRFKKPTDLSKMTGTAIAKVTGYSFVPSKFSVRQLELIFITQRGTEIRGWFTLEAPQQMNMLLKAGILTEDENEFLQVVGIEDMEEVTIRVEGGKIKEVKKHDPKAPVL